MPYVPEQRWNNPMSSEAIDALIARLDLSPEDVVVDVGCGNGEVLARIVEAHGCRGVGIDPDPAALAAARERTADHRGREEWVESEVGSVDLASFGAQTFICLGSTHAFGGPGKSWRATLEAFAKLGDEGASALIGEGFWERDPPDDYLAATGITRDECTGLVDLSDTAEAIGWTPLQVRAATHHDWDAFESTSWHGAENAFAADPSLAEVTERRRGWRRAYLRWGRTTLGFATWLLRRSATS